MKKASIDKIFEVEGDETYVNLITECQQRDSERDMLGTILVEDDFMKATEKHNCFVASMCIMFAKNMRSLSNKLSVASVLYKPGESKDVIDDSKLWCDEMVDYINEALYNVCDIISLKRPYESGTQ